MIGRRFTRLVVEAEAPRAPRQKRHWVCRCDCGATHVVRDNNLKSGSVQSCGCLNREKSRERIKVVNKWSTHGQSNTHLYRAWSRMRDRCGNPNATGYALYGGRGISVCAEWDTFPAFAEWANANGYRADLSLDRINNDGGYSPDNCRWADDFQQARNRRSTKLTEQTVTAIRASNEPRRVLAARFGITPRHVSRVRAGTTWPGI